MAIVSAVDILEHNVFKTRDARDPLGIWAYRNIVTGDASGGSVKATANAPQTNRVYTCLFLTISADDLVANEIAKFRLLTNFPPAGIAGGRAGFSFNRVVTITRTTVLTSPEDNWGSVGNDMGNSDKLLLWGPLPVDTGSVPIVELEVQTNTLNAVYFFEAWGYYWDRVAVLEAPGGPRFPGSS